MLSFDEITDYCLNKKGAWADFPFGSETLVLKTGKHYFCTLSVVKGRRIMTVKCSPEEGLRRRGEYPEWVTRGYHCPPVQQPYNNTVFLDGEVPESEIFAMIDFAYDYNLKKFTRREREEFERSAEQ